MWFWRGRGPGVDRVHGKNLRCRYDLLYVASNTALWDSGLKILYFIIDIEGDLLGFIQSVIYFSNIFYFDWVGKERGESERRNVVWFQGE